MVISQNVAFLSSRSLIQICYFKNGPNVTVKVSNNNCNKFHSPILLFLIFDFYQMSKIRPTFLIC